MSQREGAWPTIAVSILLDLQVGKATRGNNEVFVEGLHFHPTNVPGGAWAQESSLRQGGREANPRGSVKALRQTRLICNKLAKNLTSKS